MEESVSEARNLLGENDRRGLDFFENALRHAVRVQVFSDQESYVVTAYGESGDVVYQNSGVR